MNLQNRDSLYHVKAAPYIQDLTSLLSSVTPDETVLFYRTGGLQTSVPVVDRFAAGTFETVECPWASLAVSRPWSQLMQRFHELEADRGALAGYISYEAGFMFELRWHDNAAIPSTGYAWRFAIVPCWYEVNHQTRTGYIKYHISATPEVVRSFLDRIDLAARNAYQPALNLHSILMQNKLNDVAKYGERSRQDYECCINHILNDITAGRYYELNFTQRFNLKSFNHPAQLFSELFGQLLPARGFYAGFGNQVICSWSPELLLQKSETELRTIPIKGSHIQQPGNAIDDKLKAEHIMVVDLARNDLGRVSDLAPVKVNELMRTRHFGGLYHLESVITGQSSFGWKQILQNTFPAASITGAPKVEVVSAIRGYEVSPRQVYTGTCGWIESSEQFDLNVAIRTAVATQKAGGWHYHLGAGGAIVSDSDPGDEYDECLRKVTPLINAILS